MAAAAGHSATSPAGVEESGRPTTRKIAMPDQRDARNFAESICAVSRVFTQLAAAFRDWADSVSPAFLSLAEELELAEESCATCCGTQDH